MKNQYNSIEQNRFETISEFKECLIRGGEVEFSWNGTNYTVGSYVYLSIQRHRTTKDLDQQIQIRIFRGRNTLRRKIQPKIDFHHKV